MTATASEDLMGSERRAISVRVELRLTTFQDDEDREGEAETIVWAETSLDPAVGFNDAADTALKQLVTVMAVETIVGTRLQEQVKRLNAKAQELSEQ